MIRDTSGQDRPLSKPTVAKPWRRWGSRVVLALAVLAVLTYVVHGWLGAGRAVERGRIRIARVERGTLVRDIVADGRVVAANSPTLYAVAAGVVDFHVRAGDRVKQGQLLATIASPDLQSRLAQEQATLAGLDAAVGKAALDVEHGDANVQMLIAQANIDHQTAAREVEINREMAAKGVIPDLELRRSEDALRKADVAVKHAHTEAGLQRKGLTFDLSTHQQSLDRQRSVVHELERQVAELEIKSPVDGQVSQLLVQQRAAVAANAPVITVVDLGAFELEIKIADSFARELQIGMAADITAGATSFKGQVRSVSPEVVDGNVATRLEFVDKRPEGLRQNQRLNVRILIDERANVLKIERGPFLESGGGNIAYFVEGDVAERRSIRTGAVSLNAVEIVSGAQVGDQIVVTAIDMFNNAPSVRIAN
jgi:HlyD family secretion protein